ncbi:uncharacterized protein LOC131875132 [Cryptomeria japonica]|uniref:uncharacterized protein LOC131875132 n=1 Tax=Cryptomeria japonica TaxID=3369 RepID=UPI0027DA52D3|nr:uncharacterized protein LOC131875132 [Cryptomeria japonica]
MAALKENLQHAQNQQKLYADCHRTERTFEVGDMVFLRLQLYRQSSIKGSGAKKLKPHFYGPYQVIRKVGRVAYELQLPPNSKIHNTFHVSYLKKALGQQVVPTMELPPLDYEGVIQDFCPYSHTQHSLQSFEDYVPEWCCLKNLSKLIVRTSLPISLEEIEPVEDFKLVWNTMVLPDPHRTNELELDELEFKQLNLGDERKIISSLNNFVWEVKTSAPQYIRVSLILEEEEEIAEQIDEQIEEQIERDLLAQRLQQVQIDPR